MRIAIIGSGISGLACAWRLGHEHEVVLFEANAYLGGHTHTHDIELEGGHYRVDTGFIVHNPRHYPLLHQVFDELGVASQPTTMSFSVRNAASGLEYNATTLDTLFCQRRNLVSPRFLGMVKDLLRFYKEAPAVLDGAEPGPTLGEYLAQHRYGAAFRDEHLVPMASALWSSPAEAILKFPVQYLVRFMANHQMLQVDERPEWQVVRGGSKTYIEAMQKRWRVDTRLSCPVRSVTRQDDGVWVRSLHAEEAFDQVVFACHSDQALAILGDASEAERDVLGAIPYQVNDTVLHTDARVLPKNRKAWAAWNALLPATPDAQCTVSYYMNLLQDITAPRPFIVSLNQTASIDPRSILRRMSYAHPVYTEATVRAQRRKAEIQGVRRTWFAGAYWGWGFHEDGMRSAMDVVAGLRCSADTASPVRSPGSVLA